MRIVVACENSDQQVVVFLVWKASELQQALNPLINKLWAQDPEALPFRTPVDPEALCIPVSIWRLFKYLIVVAHSWS